MKIFLLNIITYLCVFVAVISFWVWLGTLLIWKIFAISGAGNLIFPAFYLMLGGIVGIVLMGVYYAYFFKRSREERSLKA